jgi:DNA-binding MarR family transcriptional regulator
VLSALAGGPTRTQAALAESIKADKTRIIPVLDDLQRRGLIERRQDPADRRVRLLALTPAGRELYGRVRAAIRREEEQLLATVPAGDAERFLQVLRRLSPGG